MSDEENDEELLELLRKSLGLVGNDEVQPPKIKVLEDAEFIYNNSADVALDMRGTKAAASNIYRLISEKGYSTKTWSSHDLHPKLKDKSSINFIFLMDLLNFSFWPASDKPDESYTVAYRGKEWSGYWSLVAAIQRALDDNIPFTTPSFWSDRNACSDEILRGIFKSSTSVRMPLLNERIHCIREASQILLEVCSFCSDR